MLRVTSPFLNKLSLELNSNRNLAITFCLIIFFSAFSYSVPCSLSQFPLGESKIPTWGFEFPNQGFESPTENLLSDRSRTDSHLLIGKPGDCQF
jgi:hypothetical protein